MQAETAGSVDEFSRAARAVQARMVPAVSRCRMARLRFRFDALVLVAFSVSWRAP